MIKKIITINKEKCVGCGLCVNTCHQSALGIVDGKATLMREDYCDGLGKCLPVCPTDAISFTEKEVTIQRTEASTQKISNNTNSKTFPGTCPGNQIKVFGRNEETDVHLQVPKELIEKSIVSKDPNAKSAVSKEEDTKSAVSKEEDSKPAVSKELEGTSLISEKSFTHLHQWPVQIKLVPDNAAYFENAHLLIAADCAAYAYGNFHDSFMRNRVTLIGCLKLDEGDYSEKLTAILKNNTIKSLTIVRMEVPCCSGIENAAKIALKNCDKLLPWQVVTLTINGKVLEN